MPTRVRAASSSARRPGPRCPAIRSAPRSGRRRRGPARPARPRGRPGGRRSRDGGPAGPGGHGLADDLLTATLLTARCPVAAAPRPCTPRCGSTPRPGPTSRPCAPAACTCSTRPSGRLTGADTGPGRLPEPEEMYAACRAVAATGAAARRARTWPGGTRSSSAPAAPASRWTRCGSWATARPASRAYALAAAAAARGAEVTLVAANLAADVPAPPAGGVDVRAGRHGAGAARAAVAGRGRQATWSSWPPPSRTSARRPTPSTKIKKTYPATPGPDPGAGDRAGPQPRHAGRARSARARAASAGQVLVGFAAETGDDADDVLARAGPSWPARAATCWSSTRSGSARTFGQDEQQRAPSWRATAPSAP